MSIREVVAREAFATSSEHDPQVREVRRRRHGLLTKEIPGIIRALYELIKAKPNPLRKVLLCLAAFELVIAVFAGFQPLVLSLAADALKDGAPYTEVMLLIIAPVILLAVPHDLGLAFARDLFSKWYVEPRFLQKVSLRSVTYCRSPSVAVLITSKGPALQEGRDVAWDLVAFLTREPFVAIKGIVIATGMFYVEPWLTAVVMCVIVLNVYITFKMRKRITIPMADMQTSGQKVKSIENELLDGDGDEGREIEYQERWSAYIHRIRRAERLRLLYQKIYKEAVTKGGLLATMLIAAWLMHTGQIEDVAIYLYLIVLAQSGDDPFEVVLGFLTRVVENREKLRRLGLVTGIDFGLSPPPEAV